MLSILIPVFNFDVRRLVMELHDQAAQTTIEFEILLFDDASDFDFRSLNKGLERLPKVTYKQFEKNQGRSKIRNVLAEEAKFPNLLFMDCDSMTPDHLYIKRYVEHFNSNSLVCGGRTYESDSPIDVSTRLHWLYGKEREVKSAEIRNVKPYEGFQTNNFLIPKSFFLQLKFEEALSGYGHEDTLFGEALQTFNLELKHIDNPLLHIGLERSEEFLNKTRQGVKNLSFLYEKHSFKGTRLVKAFEKLKKYHLLGVFSSIFARFEQAIFRNLHSKQPNLKYFDLYKLYLFIQYVQKK